MMIIVPATLGDLDEIQTIVNAAYRGLGATAGWTSEVGVVSGTRTDAAALRALLLHKKTVVLLLRPDAKAAPIGCVAVQLRGDSTCEISMLAIHPDKQAAGSGRMLLAAAEEHARQAGALRAELAVVHIRESLIAWYERQGYQRTGATKPFPYDEPSVGNPLRDDLNFVVLAKALAPT